jgi:pilus assembly protein CpaE
MHTRETPARIAVMAVCLDPASYRAVSHILAAVPGAAPLGNLDHYIGAEREICRAFELALAPIRVCIIDYDRNTEEAVELTERLRSEYPDLHLFAASGYSEPERIIAAMRPGCGEYLLKPIEHERVLDALTRAEAKQKERKRSKVRGTVITLLGAKGGTGVTTLALHLALELCDGGKRKCLFVDQHPSLGSASLYLGTGRHQYSFYELASNRDRLDEELLKGFLQQHASGLHLLDSPEAVDGMHGVSPSAVEHTLGFLAETYQVVVVDCPPGLSEATMACLAQSDRIAIVMNADLPSVRNAVRYVDHLGKLGYDTAAIRIVLNRHSKKGPLSDDRIEKAMGREISLRVPNSYNEVIQAINAGQPIAAGNRSDFSAAIRKWAQEVSGNGGGDGMGAGVPVQRRNGVKEIFGG